MQALLKNRIGVVGPALLVGVLFTVWVAATELPSSWGFGLRIHAWCCLMAGPLVGIWGFDPNSEYLVISLILIAAGIVPANVLFAMILAHPIRPSPLTACVSLMGILGWFFCSYFLLLIVFIYGA